MEDIKEKSADEKINELEERIKNLERKLYRFEYIADRVETLDAQKGQFRYC